MKKRCIALCLLATLIVSKGHSQDRLKYHQDAGTSYHIFNLFESFGQGQQIGVIGFDYTPRYLLTEIGTSGSVSLSAPLAFGFTLSSDPRFNYIMVDIPICAEVAIGHEASRTVDFPVGAFAGVGGDYNFLSGSSLRLNSFSPIFTFGARVFLGRQSYTLRIIKALTVPQEGQTIRFSLSTNF